MKVGAAVEGNKVWGWGHTLGVLDLLGKKQLLLLDRLNTAFTNKQPSEAQETWMERELSKYFFFLFSFTIASCALKLSQ